MDCGGGLDGGAMTIQLRPAREDDIRQFVAWRYEPPYDAYDITTDQDEEVEYFLAADIHCHALVEGGEVVGYCTFGRDARVSGGDYSADAVDIGLGVKPSRTGSGDGRYFVAAAVDRAKEMFSPRFLRVTISAGNQRALRVWSNAGFSEVSRFGTDRVLMGSSEFVILVSEVGARERS